VKKHFFAASSAEQINAIFFTRMNNWLVPIPLITRSKGYGNHTKMAK